MDRQEFKFSVGLSTDLDISAYSEEEAWEIIGRIARQIQDEVQKEIDLNFHAWWDKK